MDVSNILVRLPTDPAGHLLMKRVLLLRDWEAFKPKHLHVLVGVSYCREIAWLELNVSQDS